MSSGLKIISSMDELVFLPTPTISGTASGAKKERDCKLEAKNTVGKKNLQRLFKQSLNDFRLKLIFITRTDI